MIQLRKHLGLLLIIGGLLLSLIPVVNWGMGTYYQRLELVAMEEESPPVITEPTDEPSELPDGLPPIKGILEIPKIQIRVVVIHGVTKEDLKRGPGFYPQSKYPERGNVSIAAHRGVYGSWFRNVNKLDPGDEILLTLGTKVYRYQVRQQFVTHSRDWSVVASTDEPELTLTTCLFTTSTKRLIVKADLIEVTIAQVPRRLDNN